MSRLSLSLFTATMGLSLAAMLADAQPAPKAAAPAAPKVAAPAAPATTEPARPAAAPATPAECPHCAHKAGAAPTASASEDAAGPMPRGKPGMMQHDTRMQHGMMMQHSTRPDHHARLHEITTLADIKVQTTKFGAVIQLTAKKPADTAKVQELAKELGAHLSEPPAHATAAPGHAHGPNH